MIETTPIDQMSYESAFAELENIIATLEANQRPLDEAMALFERGQALAARCAALLDRAELRIRQLTGADLSGAMNGSRADPMSPGGSAPDSSIEDSIGLERQG